MTIYESLKLMLSFGVLIVAIVTVVISLTKKK